MYISVPHAQHHPLALAAIAAGKNVPIEKPIALTAAQAEEIAQAATDAGVFAMEAMWSRYLPQSDILAQVPERPNFDPAVGSGVMIDAGVYSLWFAHSMLGGATARIDASGRAAVYGTAGAVHYETSFVFPARLRLALDSEEYAWGTRAGLSGGTDWHGRRRPSPLTSQKDARNRRCTRSTQTSRRRTSRS